MGKEFEKWFDLHIGTGELHNVAYESWRAALEWVIREYYESNRALGSIVNEELEEK